MEKTEGGTAAPAWMAGGMGWGPRKFHELKSFFSEVKTELKKVTWPSRQDLIDSTKVVIVATLIMTVFVGIVDQVLSRIIKLVFG